jgi:hypothetical protein
MTIALPLDPYPNGATPMLRDFGGVLSPFLGGPEIRINRVGTRFGITVTMPPLPSGSTGRVFVSRLLQARQERVLMPWPLLDFDPGVVGTPLINTAVASGSSISIKGLPANYSAKEGQFFSVIRSGRRYVHMFTADTTASGAGVLAINIFPPLRTSLAVNDVVEMTQPMIEGHVLPGNEVTWEMALDRNIGLSFSVLEAA